MSQMVQDKRFRADLYYRLNVFPLTLPPLRERKQDIPLLAEYFVQEFSKKQGKVIESIPDQVMRALEYYDWPGNIRELQNVIERGVIMTPGPVLSPQTTTHLVRAEAKTVSVPALAGLMGTRTLVDAERAHITAVLRETKWVVGGPRGAAIQLGLPRTTLLAKMQRLGIPGGTSRGRPTRRFACEADGPVEGLPEESVRFAMVGASAD
jgi:formate hydrogenlyase transcriptional activator